MPITVEYQQLSKKPFENEKWTNTLTKSFILDERIVYSSFKCPLSPCAVTLFEIYMCKAEKHTDLSGFGDKTWS